MIGVVHSGILEGKVVIVTGASRGIGAASAKAFARAGARVVLASRDGAAVTGVAHDIDPDGVLTLPMAVDVTDWKSVERMVGASVHRFGRLDAAFNNAGSGHMPAPVADLSLTDFEAAMSVNVRGTFNCMKYEIAAMLKSGGGSIVNMSSTAGLQGVMGMAGYAAGKHAIIGLTRSAALDYARNGIRVNALAPGPIAVERFTDSIRLQAASAVPMGRVGETDEVAQAALWLCSDASSFVTGSVVTADGGRMAGVWFSRQAGQN